MCGFFRARTTRRCSAHRVRGVPALRPTKGAPNLRMSIPAWSMTSVYPASARPAEAVSVHPVSRVGQTNSELSASSCRGRLPCGSRSLDPAATFPYPEGWGMPASCACQLEAFRSVPFDRFRHRPLSGERATARTDAPVLPKQRRPKSVVGVPLSIRIRTSPSGRRAPPILRVPFRPRSARCRLRDPGQVVFQSHPFGLPLGINAIRLPEPPRRTRCRSFGLSSLT